MSEVVFLIEEAAEGGYSARADGGRRTAGGGRRTGFDDGLRRTIEWYRGA